MKKRLCASDHSELSQRAEVLAANWAKTFGAELIYAHVSHITEKDIDPEASRSSLTILKDVALKEHQVLTHAREVADKAGIPKVQYVLLRSHKVALALVDYAKEEGVDHILVGSAARQLFTQGVRGSIAGQIVGGAHCHVTVVR
jgi:nucleotide-binding universal stress UspA family protein